jgi:hypothetical protein
MHDASAHFITGDKDPTKPPVKNTPICSGHALNVTLYTGLLDGGTEKSGN